MPRHRTAVALLWVFVFALPAAAESSRGAFSHITPHLRTETRGGAAFDCLSIEGRTRYPQGTRFWVGVRPESSAHWIWQTSATARGGQFVVEFPPSERRLAVGRYVVAVQFRMEDQSEAVREEIRGFEEFGDCLTENPEKLKELMELDRARAERYLAILKKDGRCPMHDQLQEGLLLVGTAEDIDRAFETEEAALRDILDAVKDQFLLAEELGTQGAGEEAWSAWFQDVGSLEDQVGVRSRRTAWSARGSAWGRVESAFHALRRLADAFQSPAVDPASLATLDEAAAAGDRDAGRRAALARRCAAETAHERAQAERDLIETLAEALYGPAGLKPAPARRIAWAEELRSSLRLAWTFQPDAPR